MLDGRKPDLELALKSAYDEFHRTEQFLEKYVGVFEKLVEADGKVDYRRLDEALGGRTKDIDLFVRELHLARGAIAIRRKALLADAASVALADPDNPYTALRKFLESQVHQVEEADRMAAAITEELTNIELKGRWHESDKSVTSRQGRIRGLAASPTDDGAVDLCFISTANGDIVQVIASDTEDETKQIASAAQD